MKEVSTKSEQGGKGGPVSETTTFSYYATFALVLCSGPISGIRRIWAGANLIYDAGSGDIETIIASNALAENFRVHLGTADQMPDERIQATLGTDCPAWRGIAYIVFDDFALADYSNNLAATQFKVEVVSVGSASPVATEIGDAVLTEDAPFATWRYDDGVLRAMRMGRYSATSGWVDGYYEEIYRFDMTRVKSSLLPTQSGYGEKGSIRSLAARTNTLSMKGSLRRIWCISVLMAAASRRHGSLRRRRISISYGAWMGRETWRRVLRGAQSPSRV